MEPKYDWTAMRKANVRFEWGDDAFTIYRQTPHGIMFRNADGKVRQWSKCTVAHLLDTGEMVAVEEAKTDAA